MTSTPSPRAPFWARLLFAVALCMPIIEVVVVVLVWHVIGWWTLLALAACFCLGFTRAGRRTGVRVDSDVVIGGRPFC